jgi:hypothetical protein
LLLFVSACRSSVPADEPSAREFRSKAEEALGEMERLRLNRMFPSSGPIGGDQLGWIDISLNERPVARFAQAEVYEACNKAVDPPMRYYVARLKNSDHVFTIGGFDDSDVEFAALSREIARRRSLDDDGVIRLAKAYFSYVERWSPGLEDPRWTQQARMADCPVSLTRDGVETRLRANLVDSVSKRRECVSILLSSTAGFKIVSRDVIVAGGTRIEL